MIAGGAKRLVPEAAFRLACRWEVTARKAGNVHEGASFADVKAADFLASAEAAAPLLADVQQRGVGATVRAAVRRRQAITSANTNLGILLLTVPLAAVPTPAAPVPAGAAWLRRGIRQVLDRLTPADAEEVYAAIREARPGGLGRVAVSDVHAAPPSSLVAAMRLAARRDAVARQYANGFAQVFTLGLPALRSAWRKGWTTEEAIILAQLRLLARLGDSLIARKVGMRTSREAAARAAAVLTVGWPHLKRGWRAYAGLDAWLRADGHRRNPGTTADLVTAALFVALRCGLGPEPDLPFVSTRYPVH
ncbi:MAG TPA: triphosphoribosyl-dephospho-CoA synthase [Gemmatales bacterium]|nr:triphosphoribosyl-dephospho-CoA synthase [Gemmatales bacterium]